MILALLAALAVAGAAIGVLAQAQIAAVRAQTAADASALAAAPETFRGGSPSELARRFARENGAELVTCECAVDRSWRTRRVTTAVRIPIRVYGLGTITVTRDATAEFEPVALLR